MTAKRMAIMSESEESSGRSGTSSKSSPKEKKTPVSWKPSFLHRDWQRITDRLQVLMSRMSAVAAGEPVTDEQIRSFESLSVKVVRDLKDMQHKISAGSYDLMICSKSP